MKVAKKLVCITLLIYLANKPQHPKRRNTDLTEPVKSPSVNAHSKVRLNLLNTIMEGIELSQTTKKYIKEKSKERSGKPLSTLILTLDSKNENEVRLNDDTLHRNSARVPQENEELKNTESLGPPISRMVTFSKERIIRYQYYFSLLFKISNSIVLIAVFQATSIVTRLYKT